MVPLATTTVTIKAVTEAEPGDAPTLTTIAAGVAAHIGRPSGSERLAPGGGTSRVDATCWCALTPAVTATGRVVDDQTGEVWEIIAVAHRHGLGLDHTRIDLRATTGRAA